MRSNTKQIFLDALDSAERRASAPLPEGQHRIKFSMYWWLNHLDEWDVRSAHEKGIYACDTAACMAGQVALDLGWPMADPHTPTASEDHDLFKANLKDFPPNHVLYPYAVEELAMYGAVSLPRVIQAYLDLPNWAWDALTAPPYWPAARLAAYKAAETELEHIRITREHVLDFFSRNESALLEEK